MHVARWCVQTGYTGKARAASPDPPDDSTLPSLSKSKRASRKSRPHASATNSASASAASQGGPQTPSSRQPPDPAVVPSLLPSMTLEALLRNPVTQIQVPTPTLALALALALVGLHALTRAVLSGLVLCAADPCPLGAAPGPLAGPIDGRLGAIVAEQPVSQLGLQQQWLVAC